ncbi:hypothetical protein [Nocardioides sp. AE5]|uniref:hypothetical protein n=1 Tax=Nocardioides sp. AE5 TaxID=2962573 RepID=UPI00288212E2|nr:hypothetical protein [Nocardioides sp. AE5]MDT0200477.1 hypothetical protein [Nocardioides sp. AE5]
MAPRRFLLRARRGVLGLVLATAMLAACGSEDPEATHEEQTPCMVEGFPCDLNDVPQEVFDATHELGAEAEALFVEDEGDTTRMVQLLRDDERVLALDELEGEVIFRLDGGRPHHLYTKPTYYVGTDDLDLELPPAPPEPPASEPDGAAFEGASFEQAPGGTGSIHVTPIAYQPAGTPAQGHDIGQPRRALLLEPLGPMAGEASGKDYARQLDQESTKLGEVTYIDGRAGADVGFYEALMDLGSYQVIHISTHGTPDGFAGPRLKHLIDMPSTLHKATMDDLVDIPQGVDTGRELTWSMLDYPLQQRNRSNPDELVSIVTAEFWQINYPAGLRGTVFLADWCKSSEKPYTGRTIAGSGSAYLGWDENVEVRHAAFTASWFWRFMSQGVDVGTAMHALEMDGYTTFRGGNVENGGVNLVNQAHFTWVGADLRILDAVTSFVDAQTRIATGTKLDWTGTIGDGEEDILDKLRLEVIGVATGKEGEAELTVFLDKKKFPETFTLSQAVMQPSDHEDWATWILELTDVELPFDVTREILEKEMPWEVRVSDGSGGYGAHSVRKVQLRSVEVEATHPQALSRLANGEIVHIDGTEGDGKPDRAPIVLTVHGVDPDEVDRYAVRARISGGTLSGIWEHQWRLDDFEDLGGVDRLRFPVQLDHDLTDDNNDLTIDVRLLRDGVEVSEHAPTIQLEGRKASGCSIDLTWSGSAQDYLGSEPSVGSTVPPMSEENTGAPFEHKFEAGSTYGRDQREGELSMLLYYTSDTRIALVVNALETYGTPPPNAPAYTLDISFNDEISGGATGTFTLPLVDEDRGILTSGMQLWIPDVAPAYKGAATVTITENGSTGEERGIASDYSTAGFLSGTFEATLSNKNGDQVSVTGGFKYSRQECS